MRERAVERCEGCDEERSDVKPYSVTFASGSIEPCRYCEDCAELARMNWNGETIAIEAKNTLLKSLAPGPARIHVEDMKGATRNRANGRYTYSSDFDRRCACGHPLGAHLADAPHPCDNENWGDGAACECAKFRPIKKGN